MLLFVYIFSLLQIFIGSSVFGFIANEYKRIAICSLLTIRNIWSGIQWAKPKVILNYSMLPNWHQLINFGTFWDTKIENFKCFSILKVELILLNIQLYLFWIDENDTAYWTAWSRDYKEKYKWRTKMVW